MGFTYFEFFIALFYNEKKIDDLCTRTISSTQTIALTSEIVSTDFIKDYIATRKREQIVTYETLAIPLSSTKQCPCILQTAVVNKTEGKHLTLKHI